MAKLKLSELEFTVKSGYRTMAIFEFFAEVKKPATVTEICNGLQIPQSSTSAIIKSLHETSFLSYDSDNRTYAPTMRMAFLSSWTNSQNANAAKLPNIVEDLRQSLEENVVLAVRNGIYSQYIYVAAHDETLGKHVETGSVRPLISSATGWSFLKDENELEVGKIFRRTLHEVDNSRTQIGLKTMLEHIQFVRDNGYAFSKSDTTDDAAGIALTLPTNTKKATLAIAVAGPKQRILDKKSEIVVALKRSIADLPKNITHETLGQ